MATLSRERTWHLQPFRFQIQRDRDGRHRWYLASGTIVERHTAGFPSKLEAYQDVQRVREELAVAPIIGETSRTVQSQRALKVDRAAGRVPEHATGGEK